MPRTPAAYRRRITSEGRRSEKAMRSGRLESALRHNYPAGEAVDQAIAISDHDEDLAMRAAILYNRSTILNQMGDGIGAVDAARQAVAAYEPLDVSHGHSSSVEMMLETARGPHVVTDIYGLGTAVTLETRFEEIIGQTADAKGRLAVLLAEHEGTAAESEVRRLGSEAIATYEELLRVGHRYTRADLDRVSAQNSGALDYLAGTT